jgi:hypothetical protein
MPGLSEELGALGARKQLDLGKAMNGFLAEALPDFPHFTVLMYLVRQAKEPCSAGDVAAVTNDPKKLIQDVLDRFARLELVRTSGGLFGRKYSFERQGPRSDLVYRLIKLWEHPQAHEAVLRRILGTK